MFELEESVLRIDIDTRVESRSTDAMGAKKFAKHAKTSQHTGSAGSIRQ